MLACVPGQRAHDRPRVGTRVFKLKLTELLPHKEPGFWGVPHSCVCYRISKARSTPHAYSVMAQRELPCGKDARYAACNVEGKCLKHFPKPFYAETIIDQDGYPIYRRRDNKVSVKKGIASLLLPAGRTAHSTFVIPLELLENSTCGIKQSTHLTELMQEVELIIWDEAPMIQKYAFKALDKTLRDILGYPAPENKNKIFGILT
ncbi:ATP-dependent DNA helicase PIF1-like protein, partial [Tanacetum coccineum]